ncbi:TniQ family protein [Endozoicomonas euniceicola]|uniref:TniQ family protein n=1 Tax=Endozoicomonas euniceicola TaxID=1234143 RepID=A0ABY6GY14_9GAMM|nr:TniQ family protein [Endozoicomonas euniceicola]UYM17675.1 TniQ family protein [Endozoicomonas euniceicola]
MLDSIAKTAILKIKKLQWARMLLLSRPQPNRLESLRGYILRLSHANHYHTTQYVLELAGLWTGKNYDSASHYVLKSADLSKLAKISGNSLELLQSLQYGLDERKQSQIYNHQIANRHIRLDFPRICPQCLESNNIALAIWDIPAITVCPEHHIPLMDYCPECNTRLRWNRPGTYLCHSCESDFREYTYDQVTPEEINLSRLIAQLCMKKQVTNRTSPQPLKNKNLREVLELTSSLAVLDYQLTDDYLSSNKPLSLKTASNELLHRYYCNAMTNLNDWPNNFYGFLSSSRQIRRSRGVNAGISKEIGAPFYLLRANRQKAIYQPLWEAYCEYREIATRQTVEDLRQARLEADFIPLRTAARELEIRPEKLLKFCKKLKIKLRKGSGQQKLISRSSIAQLSEFFDKLLTMSQAAEQLGVTVYQLRSLIQNDIVLPFRGATVDKSRDWLFLTESINEFLQNVHQQCKPKGRGKKRLISLKKALSQIRFYEFGLAELTSAIFSGKIHPVRSGNDTKLCNLKFSVEEVRALRPEVESSSEYWQPPEIVNYLGCSKHVVFGLLNSGQLPMEKIELPGRTRPVVACKKTAVRQFRIDFYILSEIAVKLGVSSHAARRLLLEHQILPDSGTDIDGGYCWLYRKKKISQKMMRRLLNQQN